MPRDFDTLCKLTLKDGPNPGQEFELTKFEIIILGEPGASISISFPIVSRRHARFTHRREDHITEDLISSNGSYVYDQNREQPYTLKSGDQIRPGQTVSLIYESSAKREYESSSGIAETVIGEEISIPSLGSPQLFITVAEDNPQTDTLEQSEISIGRAEDNGIVIQYQISVLTIPGCG